MGQDMNHDTFTISLTDLQQIARIATLTAKPDKDRAAIAGVHLTNNNNTLHTEATNGVAAARSYTTTRPYNPKTKATDATAVLHPTDIKAAAQAFAAIAKDSDLEPEQHPVHITPTDDHWTLTLAEPLNLFSTDNDEPTGPASIDARRWIHAAAYPRGPEDSNHATFMAHLVTILPARASSKPAHLDPEQLRRLIATAPPDTPIRLINYGPNKPITVESLEPAGDWYGILMPLRTK